jgi:hypothetical protein
MARIEIFGTDGRREIVELADGSVTLGRGEGVDCRIDDHRVSRLHARIHPVTTNRWAVEDLGSKNGTWVGGGRIYGSHALQNGNEIIVGGTSVVFHDAVDDDGSSTVKKDRLPAITPRERIVLVELCRPIMRGTSPVRKAAQVREIADAMFTGEANVKQHLGHLYDKFLIPEEGGNRRDLLAEAAIERGAVGRSDYE